MTWTKPTYCAHQVRTPDFAQDGTPSAEGARGSYETARGRYHGSFQLFRTLTYIEPPVHVARAIKPEKKGGTPIVSVDARDWIRMKEALRNYTFNNFNPSLLPGDSPLRQDIFDKITSTAGLFLALEPQVFVSKIRCRIFRSWKAAEDYYANSLRQLKTALSDSGTTVTDHEEIDAVEMAAAAAPTAA